MGILYRSLRIVKSYQSRVASSHLTPPPAPGWLQEFHYLVLKVWHRSASSGRDRVLGLVLVDLVPLLHGLNELLGWYNIVDLAGVCRGQMKVRLTL